MSEINDWINDGHTVTAYLGIECVILRWTCPADGQDLSEVAFEELPVCRRMSRQTPCTYNGGEERLTEGLIECHVGELVAISSERMPVEYHWNGDGDIFEWRVVPATSLVSA